MTGNQFTEMAASLSREKQKRADESDQDWDDGDDELLLQCADLLENKIFDNSTTPQTAAGKEMQKEVKQNSVTDQLEEIKDDRSPLERFRPGYLWVSDLTKQHWCEQQLYYSFTMPGIVVEDPVITQGSNLHLARELAVHDVVRIAVTSNEDIWAIKLLNLLSVINGFLNNVTLAREIPIFGAPFDEDVFIVGLIDELRFDPESYTIDLQELKTRQYKCRPSKSQQAQHRLQVMLYKKLFDDLVKGNVFKETVAKHLKVNLEKELGEEVKGQMDKQFITCENLDKLMDAVFNRMQSLTCVSQVGIEYIHQDSGETLFSNTVSYSDDELHALYQEYLKFWRGQRSVKGVDIEEAWKCQKCDYSSVCEWRQKKADEYSVKNNLKNKLKSSSH